MGSVLNSPNPNIKVSSITDTELYPKVCMGSVFKSTKPNIKVFSTIDTELYPKVCMGSVLKSTNPNIKVFSTINTQGYILQYIWVVSLSPPDLTSRCPPSLTHRTTPYSIYGLCTPTSRCPWSWAVGILCSVLNPTNCKHFNCVFRLFSDVRGASGKHRKP